MRIEQRQWSAGRWQSAAGEVSPRAQLAFIFASRLLLKDTRLLEEVKRSLPHAYIMGCSTAGEIMSTHVSDDSLCLTAVHFESSRLSASSMPIDRAENSMQVGESLAQKISHDGLVHVFVLSDGLNVNGSDLVTGLSRNLPDHVTVTGGLSGDSTSFQETLVFADGEPQSRKVTILGLYGGRLKVGYGSLGGWDPFGPERVVTRSRGNVLYELDGKSALEVYKKYLGEQAKGLPATGLLFPLTLRAPGGQSPVVRTILAIDEKEQTLTFAGTIPEGSLSRLMKANFDRLIDGASGAANICYSAIGSSSPDLALLISCVGRKLILKQRIEEEVEAVRDVLGERTALTGFYSYGEISPFTPGAKCELHNQTMTITTLSEA